MQLHLRVIDDHKECMLHLSSTNRSQKMPQCERIDNAGSYSGLILVSNLDHYIECQHAAYRNTSQQPFEGVSRERSRLTGSKHAILQPSYQMHCNNVGPHLSNRASAPVRQPGAQTCFCKMLRSRRASCNFSSILGHAPIGPR